jgi:1,4-dihydroxy-2-naphthoate octaprenyltransferase
MAGLARLVRWAAVTSWVGGGIGVGLGAALGPWARPIAAPSTGEPVAVRGVSPLDVALIIAAGLLLQGLAAHAFNDREDWRSGTDPASPGLLSGGSKAVPRGLLSATHLTWAGWAALALAALLALYFTWRTGPGALLLWSVASWAATAYSLPPLRLAYRPFLGEWLAAWPAVTASAAGTFYLLTGRFSPLVLAAGGVHGLVCLGWLMQHHLPDLQADLAAEPVKLTTPAWLYRRGLSDGGPLARERAATLARLPAVAYFSLAALGSVGLATVPGLGRAFWAPALLGTLGALLASQGRLEDLAEMTRWEELLILLSVIEALALALGLACFA